MDSLQPDQELSTFASIRSTPAVAVNAPVSPEVALDSLETRRLETESRFYNGYTWCLNIFPTIEEVVHHLRQELRKVADVTEGWQRDEVLTNVFLLSCAVADTIDDYMLGERFDFSRAAAAAPGIGPALWVGEALLKAWQRPREWRLGRVRAWRQAWGAAIGDFLTVFVAPPEPDRAGLARATTRMTSLLRTELSAALRGRRPKVPAAFRSQDLTHFDVRALGLRFAAAFPNREQPVLVIGLRTAGSYFAPLLHACLTVEGYRSVESMTMRPKAGLSAWESETLARNARKAALAVVVDEPLGFGNTLAKTVGLVRKAGFPAGHEVALVPIHPTRRVWETDHEPLSWSGVRLVRLEPEHYYKRRLLEPGSVEARLAEYFTRRGYPRIRVVASAAAERFNVALQRGSEEKYHTRLKRVYEVRLEGAGGQAATRYILAKSVGWGWLGYHAFIAGERLSAFVPPVLGLRDGILYTEWLPQAEPNGAGVDPEQWIDTAASYVAARVTRMNLTADPSPDLCRAQYHKGADLLTGELARAYGWKVAAALKRPRVRHELGRHACPVPTLIDAKMRPQEWITGPRSLLKSDFEHHGQGKTEMNVTDPAYDLAEAILYWRLSEAEEERLIDRYIEESGDTGVRERLFLNKLLAGVWARTTALANLDDLPTRAQEFHRVYSDAQDFLKVQTARFCGRICGRPAVVRWRSPLVVLDIDGVLDQRVFGFSSTTVAGLRALSLLHAHDMTIALNTARSLTQVKEYCLAYGLAGGVAESGGVAWDGVGDKTEILVGAESLRQVESVRAALRQLPGVFLDEHYQYSIRAYTYERGTTVPLPTVLARNLLVGLKADRLTFHQDYLATTIIARDCDKGRGLLALLALAGHRDLETTAVGDSESDLPMFHVAHRSFAPAHITGRSIAQLLGCRVAGRPLQAGFLGSVRAILHPDGRPCDRCRSGERLPGGWGGSLFTDLLDVADQGRVRQLLRALRDPMALRAFAS